MQTLNVNLPETADTLSDDLLDVVAGGGCKRKSTKKCTPKTPGGGTGGSGGGTPGDGIPGG